MLTGVHRWYQPKGRLQPDDIATETLKLLSGYILTPAAIAPRHQRPATCARGAEPGDTDGDAE
jgi:hypothetical protein